MKIEVNNINHNTPNPFRKEIKKPDAITDQTVKKLQENENEIERVKPIPFLDVLNKERNTNGVWKNWSLEEFWEKSSLKRR